MQQQDVVDDLDAAIESGFGSNVNLAPTSVFGNIIGIFSGRLALLWQLGLAIYSSEYPAGAEGTSVDNILALNNLKRLKAKATVTAADAVTLSTGIVLQGLVVYGTPGTVVTSGSLAQTGASPPVQFSINSSITIPSPASAVHSIFFSAVPDSGAFTLTLTEGPLLKGNVFGATNGAQLTTGSIPFNAISNQGQVTFNAAPSSGTFKLQLTAAGGVLTTATINWNDSAATIQGKITALTGYSGVTVSGSIAGELLVFTWGAICHPTVVVTNNTLSNGSAVTATPTDSVQAFVNNLFDSDNAYYPFTDVSLSGFTLGLILSFGANTAVGSNPSSLNQPIPITTVATNTLLSGITVVNLNVVNTTSGSGTGVANVGVAPAAGTCTVTGPNFIAAGTINAIASPISGWTGVYNQLDCTTGSNVETDTQSLQRRSQLLAAQANGPIQAITQKVKEVSGVTAAIGFLNLQMSAQQLVSFASVPVTGSFKIVISGQTTGSLAYTSTAAQVQTAVQALTGYSAALVTGTVQYGFTVDFNGSVGGQAQPLIVITNNTTGVTITPSFARPGKSFEIVVLGGADVDIATAIYGSMPAGIQSYGTTTTQIFDENNNPVNISFSRPAEIPIYVTISLTTDIYNTPGDSGSGKNPNAQFNPQSVNTIQLDIITIGGLVTIGGTVIGFGSNGLIGAFNSVPGIVEYTMTFGTAPNPVTSTNVQMLAEQIALFEQFNVIVSYV
jgi:hypothetical protein